MSLSKDREMEDGPKEGSLADIVDFPGERRSTFKTERRRNRHVGIV